MIGCAIATVARVKPWRAYLRVCDAVCLLTRPVSRVSSSAEMAPTAANLAAALAERRDSAAAVFERRDSARAAGHLSPEPRASLDASPEVSGRSAASNGGVGGRPRSSAEGRTSRGGWGGLAGYAEGGYSDSDGGGTAAVLQRARRSVEGRYSQDSAGGPRPERVYSWSRHSNDSRWAQKREPAFNSCPTCTTPGSSPIMSPTAHSSPGMLLSVSRHANFQDCMCLLRCTPCVIQIVAASAVTLSHSTTGMRLRTGWHRPVPPVQAR